MEKFIERDLTPTEAAAVLAWPRFRSQLLSDAFRHQEELVVRIGHVPTTIDPRGFIDTMCELILEEGVAFRATRWRRLTFEVQRMPCEAR